jgi:hypothetical protein
MQEVPGNPVTDLQTFQRGFFTKFRDDAAHLVAQAEGSRPAENALHQMGVRTADAAVSDLDLDILVAAHRLRDFSHRDQSARIGIRVLEPAGSDNSQRFHQTCTSFLFPQDIAFSRGFCGPKIIMWFQ